MEINKYFYYSFILFQQLYVGEWYLIYYIQPAIINQFKVDAKVWPIVAFGFGSLIGLLDSYLYCYMSLSKTVEFVGFRL